MSPEDFWADDRTGEPAFGVGAVFEHKKGRTIRDEIADPSRAEWRAQLRDAGFSVLISGPDSYVRVYRTRYLAELLTAGASLDQQARALATWVTTGLDDLLALPPSPRGAQFADEHGLTREMPAAKRSWLVENEYWARRRRRRYCCYARTSCSPARDADQDSRQRWDGERGRDRLRVYRHLAPAI